MRVLVCDDSAVMRKAISQIVASDPSLELVDTARNGREAVEKAASLKPDLITLDIEMPELDGLTALSRIMAQCPTRVLMVSSLTTEGSRAAITALRLGAMDVVAKDQSQITLAVESLKEQILTKIRALREARPPRATVAHPPAVEPAGPKYAPGAFDAVLIGSSTGGPPALERVLSQIPADVSCPIVVAQHMPELFTKSMAERLDQQSAITVVHGEHGMQLVKGTAYVIPGGKHGRVRRAGPGRLELEISGEPREALYKPSVNELFASGARTLKNRGLAVILTGMGDDGFRGGQEFAAGGGKILAQSAETCVVYGMPKGLTAHGLVEASLSPTQIGRCLATLGGAARPAPSSENAVAPRKPAGPRGAAA